MGADHGYFLPPDAPEVLDFYAERSPIFLAARFNAERAANQGVQTGQGTPVHIVIPTPNLGSCSGSSGSAVGVGARAGGRLPAHRSTAGHASQAERPMDSAATSGGRSRRSASRRRLAPHGPPLRPRDEVAPRRRHVAHVHPRERDGGREPDARPRDRRQRLREPQPVAAGYPVSEGGLWPVVWTVMAAPRAWS